MIYRGVMAVQAAGDGALFLLPSRPLPPRPSPHMDDDFVVTMSSELWRTASVLPPVERPSSNHLSDQHAEGNCVMPG
eukprot:COSAG01_NODE_1519_length_10043_cov_9.991854_3_plen_77_part_00